MGTLHLASVVLCSGHRAPRNRPSCPLCCPLSKIELLVQKVTAEARLDEETMLAVTISWRHVAEGLADREIVGEDVVRDTVRCALPETSLGLQNA